MQHSFCDCLIHDVLPLLDSKKLFSTFLQLLLTQMNITHLAIKVA